MRQKNVTELYELVPCHPFAQLWPKHTHTHTTAKSSSIFIGHKVHGHDIQFSSRWTGHTEHKNLPSASYLLMFRYVPPVISSVHSKWRMHKIHKITRHRHKAQVASAVGRMEISCEISLSLSCPLELARVVPSNQPSAGDQKRWEEGTVTNSSR